VSSLGELIDDAALFPPGNAPMPVAAADPLLAPDVPVWVELPWTAAGRAALDELHARRGPRPAHAKFRTGGAVVPPVDVLAGRIVACHAGVPLGFKCTAGLHSAVRHALGLWSRAPAGGQAP
jgi:hypothetical protein